jgi:hypothetical protein
MKKNSKAMCATLDENTFLVILRPEVYLVKAPAHIVYSKSWASECRFHIYLVVLAPLDKAVEKCPALTHRLEKSLKTICSCFYSGWLFSSPIWAVKILI